MKELPNYLSRIRTWWMVTWWFGRKTTSKATRSSSLLATTTHAALWLGSVSGRNWTPGLITDKFFAAVLQLRAIVSQFWENDADYLMCVWSLASPSLIQERFVLTSESSKDMSSKPKNLIIPLLYDLVSTLLAVSWSFSLRVDCCCGLHRYCAHLILIWSRLQMIKREFSARNFKNAMKIALCMGTRDTISLSVFPGQGLPGRKLVCPAGESTIDAEERFQRVSTVGVYWLRC